MNALTNYSLVNQFTIMNINSVKRPIGFRFFKFIFTIEAKFQDKTIIACGEGNTERVALLKAHSELIERITLITYAKNHPEIKTSNGWAAHPVNDIAQRNAILELIERDSSLKHWYSKTPMTKITEMSLPPKIQTWAKKELATSEFPRLVIMFSNQWMGPVVTCYLLNNQNFGVCGRATKNSLIESIESAISEACRGAHQTLLRSHFKETVYLKNKIVDVKISPGAHEVYYAYQEPFSDWIFSNDTISYPEAEKLWDLKISSLFERKAEFNLTTPLQDEAHPIFVAFAEHHECLPLSWGLTTDEFINVEPKIKNFFGSLSDDQKNYSVHNVA